MQQVKARGISVGSVGRFGVEQHRAVEILDGDVTVVLDLKFLMDFAVANIANKKYVNAVLKLLADADFAQAVVVGARKPTVGVDVEQLIQFTHHDVQANHGQACLG